MHSPQVDHQKIRTLFASTQSTSSGVAETPETPVRRQTVLLALQIAQQASFFIDIPEHGHLHHRQQGGCTTRMAEVTEHAREGVRFMVEAEIELDKFVSTWICRLDGAISTLRSMQQQSNH